MKLIRQRVDDIGVEQIQVVKVPSHCSYQSVIAGRADISLQDWHGNKFADSGAKRGARLHPSNSAMYEDIISSMKLVSDVCRWYGHLGSRLSQIGYPDVVPIELAKKPSTELLLVDIPSTPAERLEGGGWLPKIVKAELKFVAQSSPQPERVPTPAASSQGVCSPAHCSHSLRQAGRLTFCNLCGKYTTQQHEDGSPKFAKQLLEPCTGSMSKPSGQLCRMRKGHNPTTNRWMGPVKKSCAQ